MSSFTGVSVITDGKHCTTSAIDAGTYSGYHLLVVKGYSRTVQEIPNGERIRSGSFVVGGHQWYIDYCPNGCEQSSTDFISLYICLDDVNTEEAVNVHCPFSFVDQVEYQKPMCIRASELHRLSREFVDCGSAEFMKRDALERSTHLKDDSFTIRFDIMVCKDPNTQEVGGTMPDIGQHLDHLLQNKVGADVTFEVSGKTFAAHRCVLAARSKVFMAQLFGPMAEGTMSSFIQIKDMEAMVFGALLSFIYTDSFPDMEEDEAQVVEEGQEDEAAQPFTGLRLVQAVFAAADRYDIQRLKFLCEEMLSEYIGVSSVASILALAEQHHCHGLKETCLNFIQVQSIACLKKLMAADGWELIITTCPSVVKEIIAKVASSQNKKRKR